MRNEEWAQEMYDSTKNDTPIEKQKRMSLLGKLQLEGCKPMILILILMKGLRGVDG